MYLSFVMALFVLNMIFSRGTDLEVALPTVIRHLSNKSIKRIMPKTIKIANNSLSDTELFLTNGFRNIFAKELVDVILNWFSERFMVVYHYNEIKVMKKFAEPKKNTVYVETTLTEVAKEFGINSNALGYSSNGEGEDIVLCSIFKDNKVAIPEDVFESHGTIRFSNEFPLIINAQINGGSLVMDEFDASIQKKKIFVMKESLKGKLHTARR